MEKEKVSYEEIIGRIKRTPPSLKNPEKAVQNIMARIEGVNKYEKRYKVMRITGLLSGAAACLLVSLLAYETVRFSGHQHAKPVYPAKWPAGTEQIRTDNGTGSVKTDIIVKINEKLKRKNRREQIYSAYYRRTGN